MSFSFCIITTRETGGYLKQVIESIRREGLDHEIVVVGGDNPGEGVIHIPWDEGVYPGAISRKKNLAAKIATFENLVMMHDYFQLLPGWRAGWDAFGDRWEVAMNRIANADGHRYRDWVKVDGHWDQDGLHAPLKFLPYEVQGRTHEQYVSGGYFLIKKQLLFDFPLDENRGWGQSEDVELSYRLREAYADYRMNPLSTVQIVKKDKPHNPMGGEKLVEALP